MDVYISVPSCMSQIFSSLGQRQYWYVDIKDAYMSVLMYTCVYFTCNEHANQPAYRSLYLEPPREHALFHRMLFFVVSLGGGKRTFVPQIVLIVDSP